MAYILKKANRKFYNMIEIITTFLSETLFGTITSIITTGVGTYAVTAYFNRKTKILGKALAKGYFLNLISPKVEDPNVTELIIYRVSGYKDIVSKFDYLNGQSSIVKRGRDYVEILPNGTERVHDVPTTITSVKAYAEEKKLNDAKVCKHFFETLEKDLESHKHNGQSAATNFRKVTFKTI